MNTRGLHGLTASRIADKEITLEYSTYTDSDDGSAIVETTSIQLKASVASLQPKDIERLEIAGIICKNGVTIVIPECVNEQPEKIIYNDKNYRVVNWSFDFDYVLGSQKYGTVIATCDLITIPNASILPGGSGS
jgi:hypothetical protein